ncbi:MAG: hypothetical protein ABIH46_07155 [Chloroflexota bacterium]
MEVDKKVMSLIEFLFGTVIVVACIVIVVNYLPSHGREVMDYGDVRKACLIILGFGIVAGVLLARGIRGLLEK